MLPTTRFGKFVASPYVGGVLCVLAALWEAFWLVGPPIGVGETLAHQYIAWGFAALVISFLLAFTAQQVRIHHYEQDRLPKASLAFDARDPLCCQFGQVTRRVSDQDIRCEEYIYAVGVVNQSSSPVSGCRLVLETSNPHDTSQQRLGIPMRVKGDPKKESDGVFLLNSSDGRSPSRHVEFLREVVPLDVNQREQADIQLQLANTASGQPNWFTERNGVNLLFRLEGNMAESVRFSVFVRYDAKRRRWLVENRD